MIVHSGTCKHIHDVERIERCTQKLTNLLVKVLPVFSLVVPSTLAILSAMDTVVVDFRVRYVRVERHIGSPIV